MAAIPGNRDDRISIGPAPVFSRTTERDRFFTIERLTSPERDNYRYRITLRLAGDQNCSGEVDVSHRMQPEEIRHALLICIREITDSLYGLMVAKLNRSYHGDSGIYDNTGASPPVPTEPRPTITNETVNRGNTVDGMRIALSDYSARLDLYLASRLQEITPEEFYASQEDTLDKRKKIQDKAMKLLAQKIGWRKMRSLKKIGYFEEIGAAGVFRFYLNDSGGVKLLQTQLLGGKKRTMEWDLCIQSAVADMPKADIILARWLEWKSDEERFLATANFRNVRTKDEALTITRENFVSILSDPIMAHIMSGGIITS